jgi:hypothetical protein
MMRTMSAVFAAALAVAPAACDDGGGGTAEGGGGQTQQVQETPAPGETGEAGDGGQTNQPPPPPPGEALASRDVQSEGYSLTIDITELKRQGQSATLSFRITNTGGGDSYWGMYETLGTQPNDYTVSGVVLVDPVNAQRYLVARSGGEDGPCACSQATDDILLYVGDSAEFFATYAAPPPEVTTVNVELPTFGAFTDVPVS